MIFSVEMLSCAGSSRSGQFWVSYPMFTTFTMFGCTTCCHTRAISDGFSPSLFVLPPIVPSQNASHRRSLPISGMCAGWVGRRDPGSTSDPTS